MMAAIPQTDSLDAIAALLPVRDCETLLPRLAELWRNLCDCEAALVSHNPQDGGERLSGWSIAGEPPQFVVGESVESESSQFPFRREYNFKDGRITACLFATTETEELASAAGLMSLSIALLDQAEQVDTLRRRFEQDEAARRWEKLESLAEFAAGAGHEINNPVATITGRAAQLLRDETDPDRRRSLATIGGQALRIRDMIGDVMLFARPPEPSPETVVLGEVVDRVLEQLEAEIVEKNCNVNVAGESGLTLWADRTQLEIVIANLLRNSLEAIDTGSGEVTIAWTSNDVGEAMTNEQRLPLRAFTVTDNGCGFSEIERRHLFDPFYSGRQAGRGLGFGLCKCWRIVSNHGGRIDVESQPGRTQLRIVWPAGA